MGKKYSILVVLLILMITNSWGRVIFRSVNYTTSGPPFGNNVQIDFDQDGVIDITINLRHDGVPAQPSPMTAKACNPPYPGYIPGAESIIDAISVSQLGTNAAYTPSTVNAIIGATGSYSTSMTQGGLRVCWKKYVWNYDNTNQCYRQYSTNLNGEVTRTSILVGPYLGVKFIKNGNLHYGYIKFEDLEELVTGYSGYRISEIAYESVPGYPIKAGDKVGYFSDFFNSSANIIRGKVYYDANSNCTYNVGEKGIPNMMVYTTTGNYGAMTDADGNYEMYVPGGTSSYSVEVDTTPRKNVVFSKTCLAGPRTVSFSGNNLVSANNNISLNTTGCAKLFVNIYSERSRRCFRNNTTVAYCNRGIVSSAPATISVVMPTYIKALSSIPAWDSQSGDTLFYNIGAVAPFSIGAIKITDSVVCGDESIRGLTQCRQAIINPINYCSTIGTWDQSDLRIKGTCVNSVFLAEIGNYGLTMQDSVSYRIFMDGTLVKTKKIKMGQAQVLALNLPTNGKALRIEVDQHIDHPDVSMRSLNFEGCGNFITDVISKNRIGQFPTNENGSAISTYCQPILDSYDPNDKQANPSGLGNDHRILPNGDIEYTIRFQNTGNDEAYTVVVVDTLDSNLDVGSFETVAASHSYKLEMTGKSNPRLVWIFGGINLPDSITNEPASHGFITYRISQKPGLSNGTVLNNKAHIFFDYNSAIITNNVAHKIGLEYPADTLKALSQLQSQQICETSTLALSSPASGYGTVHYLWYKDGTPLSSETSSSLSINSASSGDGGSYRCRIENTIDTIFSKTISVTVNARPELSVTDPEASCNTVSIINSYEDENATSGVVSYWKDANATIPLNTPTQVSQSGTYYIKKEVTTGCEDIEPIQITINTSPQLSVTDPSQACSSVSIVNTYVDANSTVGAVSYWENAGATISLATPADIANTGTYYIKKETSQGCSDIKPVHVTIHTTPQLSITDPPAACTSVDISNCYSDLTTTAGTISFWEDVNTTIQVLNPATVSESGTYYVRKETSFGCMDIKPVAVAVTVCSGTQDEIYAKYGLKIYPNPVMDKITIDHKDAQYIILSDNKGNIIVSKPLSASTDTIDMESFSSGIYHLAIRKGDRQYLLQIVKE